ncbi:unnamed protein product, partial [Porites evermanni]
LCTPGDKTALESQGISGTDEVTETMQILEAEGIEKVQDMDEVMQIDESLTIPELEQVSMDTPTGNAGNCTTCKTLRSEVTQLRGKVTRLKSKLISNQDQWVETFKSIQQPKQLLMVNAELGLEDESEDEQAMQDGTYEEFECDEDPTRGPEEIEDAYKKLKEDDDSVKAHQNPSISFQSFLTGWIYKEKKFERNRRELFSFPNFFFCFSSATWASFQNPNLTYFICSNFLTFQSGATLCVYVVIQTMVIAKKYYENSLKKCTISILFQDISNILSEVFGSYPDYVADIYDILTKTPRAELKLLEEELKGEVPDAINTMLDRESREDAISKYQTRKEKTTVLCPPTCPGKKMSY